MLADSNNIYRQTTCVSGCHTILWEEEISCCLGEVQVSSRFYLALTEGVSVRQEKSQSSESFCSLLTITNVSNNRETLDTSIPFISHGFFTCAGSRSHEIISPFVQQGNHGHIIFHDKKVHKITPFTLSK